MMNGSDWDYSFEQHSDAAFTRQPQSYAIRSFCGNQVSIKCLHLYSAPLMIRLDVAGEGASFQH